MKNLMIVGLFSLVASVAQAAPFTCTTNVHRDPRIVSTEITVNSNGNGSAVATLVTHGGMAHFITAPRTVNVQTKNFGPELVEYFNTQEDFELSVSFQPIGHQIFGTYTGEIQGRRVKLPMVCFSAAINQ